SPSPMLVIDRETLRLLAFNVAASVLYGLASEELSVMTALDLVALDQHQPFLDDLQGRGGRERTEWTHVVKELGTVDVRVTAHDVLFSGRPARLVIVADVRERHQPGLELEAAPEANRRQALNDPLTVLPNRAGLHEHVQARIDEGSEARPLAVVFLGVNRFKEINDTLGRVGGDELLNELAARLRLAFRADDTVARV